MKFNMIYRNPAAIMHVILFEHALVLYLNMFMFYVNWDHFLLLKVLNPILMIKNALKRFDLNNSACINKLENFLLVALSNSKECNIAFSKWGIKNGLLFLVLG